MLTATLRKRNHAAGKPDHLPPGKLIHGNQIWKTYLGRPLVQQGPLVMRTDTEGKKPDRSQTWVYKFCINRLLYWHDKKDYSLFLQNEESEINRTNALDNEDFDIFERTKQVSCRVGCHQNWNYMMQYDRETGCATLVKSSMNLRQWSVTQWKNAIWLLYY